METVELTSELYIKMAKKSLDKGAWLRALHYLEKAYKLNPGPLD